MSERSTQETRELLDALYRQDSGRIRATLIRLLGDFDLPRRRCTKALRLRGTWPKSGVPDHPRPWLISTARFKAIDTLRRRARFDASQDELVHYLEAQSSSAEKPNENEEDSFEDDRLRLIFTCCHPSLAPEAHVALTLREVCGLTTEEIAKAFLILRVPWRSALCAPSPRFESTQIPYEVPTPQQLPERFGAVLQVIYLVFNEGYLAAAGAEVTWAELTREAIRIGLGWPGPNSSQSRNVSLGCFPCMLLNRNPRRAARTSPAGELILAAESGPCAVEPESDRGRSGHWV